MLKGSTGPAERGFYFPGDTLQGIMNHAFSALNGLLITMRRSLGSTARSPPQQTLPAILLWLRSVKTEQTAQESGWLEGFWLEDREKAGNGVRPNARRLPVAGLHLSLAKRARDSSGIGNQRRSAGKGCRKLAKDENYQRFEFR